MERLFNSRFMNGWDSVIKERGPEIEKAIELLKDRYPVGRPEQIAAIHNAVNYTPELVTIGR